MSPNYFFYAHLKIEFDVKPADPIKILIKRL